MTNICLVGKSPLRERRFLMYDKFGIVFIGEEFYYLISQLVVQGIIDNGGSAPGPREVNDYFFPDLRFRPW